MREGVVIGVLALATYLLLGISTYSVSDPGWSSTGTGAAILNAGGATGAWVADVLLSLFGYVSYLLPILLAYRAWVLLREREEPFELDWLILSIRGVGCVLVVIAGTGILAIKGSEGSLLPFGIGGMLGETLGSVCQSAFGLAGSELLLVSLMLFGLTIFTDLSWVWLAERTGQLTLHVLAWSRVRLLEGLVSYRNSRIAMPDPAAPAAKRAANGSDTDRRPRARREPQLDDSRTEQGDPAPQEPVIRVVATRAKEPSERVLREKQGALFTPPTGSGGLPPLALLDMADKSLRRGYSADALEGLSRLLELKLADFGIEAKVVSVLPGPVITRFEIQPAAGVKVSRISNLVKDLARSLAVISVRVVEVIPGKSVVGIEIPNENRETVLLGDVLASRAYEAAKSPLSLALGYDISGEPMVVDLARMPHLLVAGTTGSGKSVGVNAMLLSLLYKSTAEDVRLIMVDPKMLELSVYEGIPHLLTPVITDMKDAANGLRWCVAEMERRYKLMAAMGVRNLAGFNRKISDAKEAGTPIFDPFWKPEPTVFVPEDEQIAPTLDEAQSNRCRQQEGDEVPAVDGERIDDGLAPVAVLGALHNERGHRLEVGTVGRTVAVEPHRVALHEAGHGEQVELHQEHAAKQRRLGRIDHLLQHLAGGRRVACQPFEAGRDLNPMLHQPLLVDRLERERLTGPKVACQRDALLEQRVDELLEAVVTMQEPALLQPLAAQPAANLIQEAEEPAHIFGQGIHHLLARRLGGKVVGQLQEGFDAGQVVHRRNLREGGLSVDLEELFSGVRHQLFSVEEISASTGSSTWSKSGSPRSRGNCPSSLNRPSTMGMNRAGITMWRSPIITRSSPSSPIFFEVSASVAAVSHAITATFR